MFYFNDIESIWFFRLYISVYWFLYTVRLCHYSFEFIYNWLDYLLAHAAACNSQLFTLLVQITRIICKRFIKNNILSNGLSTSVLKDWENHSGKLTSCPECWFVFVFVWMCLLSVIFIDTMLHGRIWPTWGWSFMNMAENEVQGRKTIL